MLPKNRLTQYVSVHLIEKNAFCKLHNHPPNLPPIPHTHANRPASVEKMNKNKLLQPKVFTEIIKKGRYIVKLLPWWNIARILYSL